MRFPESILSSSGIFLFIFLYFKLKRVQHALQNAVSRRTDPPKKLNSRQKNYQQILIIFSFDEMQFKLYKRKDSVIYMINIKL